MTSIHPAGSVVFTANNGHTPVNGRPEMKAGVKPRRQFHVAADPTPALARSIATTGTRVQPAEADLGRPGTAGTVTSATTHGTESVESREHGKEDDHASSTPGPRGLRADVCDGFDDRPDHVAGPGLVARPRPRTESLPVHYAPAGRTDLR